jgi:hypothetical protein
LGVAGGEPDAALICVPVGEVVADLAMLLMALDRDERLAGVAHRVAYHEGRENAGHVVPRDGRGA